MQASLVKTGWRDVRLGAASDSGQEVQGDYRFDTFQTGRPDLIQLGFSRRGPHQKWTCLNR